MKLVLALLLSIPTLLFSLNISQEKLWKKLNNPPPKWMKEQIDEDLHLFQESGVSKEMLNDTMREVYAQPTGRGAQFVRYRIENNQISFETVSENPTDVRIVHFVKFIELLAKYAELPDIEFIVSLWDSYDRPLFLDKTSCPIFTMCRQKSNPYGVLFPEVRFFEQRERIYRDVLRESDYHPWHKKDEKAFWRGGTSGGYYHYTEWDYKPRPRLVLFSKDHPDLLDAYFTYPYWIDDNLKEIMNSYELFTKWTAQGVWVKYKYLIAIDGNTFPSSFWWQLACNCTVLKGDSEYIEWFYKGVQPYVHYVPYSQDCSDLEKKLLWLKKHDDQARKIAENASEFAQENLTLEDMMLYFYTVFHAYAKLQR